MSTAAPIELVLYTEEDEVEKTLSRARIPSYLLDMAINLQKELTDENGSVKSTDPLFDFIAEFYKGQVTRDEIKKKTDLLECMAVFRGILARANSLAMDLAKGNPPVPSPKKK